MTTLVATYALLGITLGTPAANLRPTLGDPLLIEKNSQVSRTADYLRADDPSAVLRVTERDGVVSAIEIERERAEPTAGLSDAHGIAVGMSREQLSAKRGKPAFETMNTVLYPEDSAEDASTIYRFDGDTIESIKLVGSGSTAAGNAGLPPLAEAAGDAYATAIVDVTPTVLGSDHFRERYLAVHDCDGTGRSSTTDHRGGRTYAIVTATCTGKKRTFYFDITQARP